MPNGYYLSVGEKLKKVRRKMDRFNETETELVEQLFAVYESELREFVDQVVGLSAAERKTIVTPHNELKKQVKKVFKPGSYSASPWLEVKQVYRHFELLLGWLKNRHKYKEGELLPPATDEELEQLSAYMQSHNGEDYTISSHFVDAYRICNGMKDTVRMHDGVRCMTIPQIIECHEDLVERNLGHLLPFGECGTGNFYALSGGEVVDINHEDDSVVAFYPSMGAFFSKAHKVQRG